MMRVLQDEIYNLTEWNDLGDGVSIAEFNFKHEKENWKKGRRYIAVRKDMLKLGPDTIGKKLSLFPDDDAKIFNFRYGLYITDFFNITRKISHQMIKSEHPSAKNGGGHWGTRDEAKRLSKKIRRASAKEMIQKESNDLDNQTGGEIKPDANDRDQIKP
jgi:hypothetical protein